ncbi:MAG: hypothetical protein HC855_00675 [Rhizobiales bacterium]|nr:hypothetical protein [Hyphomicrobiales bacterium]
MSCFKSALKALTCASLMTASSQSLLAEEQPREPSRGSISQDYCENFSNIVADLRVQRQKEELLKLEEEVDAKLKEVLARTEDLKEMIRKRDEMLELASNELLKIYSRMDPESAARQLEKIETGTAAAILRRLKPQLASEILATMEVKRASLLVQIIANQIQTSNRKSALEDYVPRFDRCLRANLVRMQPAHDESARPAGIVAGRLGSQSRANCRRNRLRRQSRPEEGLDRRPSRLLSRR